MKILGESITSAIWVFEQIGEPLPEGIDSWCWPELKEYAKENPRTLVKAKNFLKTLEPNQVVEIAVSCFYNDILDVESVKDIIENSTVKAKMHYAFTMADGYLCHPEWAEDVIETCKHYESSSFYAYLMVVWLHSDVEWAKKIMESDPGISKDYRMLFIHFNCGRRWYSKMWLKMRYRELLKFFNIEYK